MTRDPNAKLPFETYYMVDSELSQALLNNHEMRLNPHSSADITFDDLMISNAVFTLHKAKIHLITPSTVFHALTGNPNKMITEEQYNLIVASLDKLRRKTINFNCLDKAGTGEDNSNPLTNAHTGLFLPLCLVNEKNPRSYIITGTPPLYEYACLNNQLIDISVKDYTIPNRVSYTYTNHSIEYIRIKHYLFQQIAPIVNQYNCQKNIQINFEQSDGSSAQKEGLYAVLSYNPKAYNNWRNKRKQIHAIVNDILYGFELEGYIYFYDFYRKGNSKRKAAPIAGVQVTFIENNH